MKQFDSSYKEKDPGCPISELNGLYMEKIFKKKDYLKIKIC